MKTHIYFLFVSFILSGALKSPAQESINIQNIFDVAINLGYLSSHTSAGSGASGYEIWNANAKAEWQASITPSPSDLVLAKPYPLSLGVDIQNIEFRLSTFDLRCPNPWYRAARSVFSSGLALSRAYVIAGGNCTGCLRNEIILASNYLSKVAVSLQASGHPASGDFKRLSESLQSDAFDMQSYSTSQEAAQQNIRLAPTILSAMQSINTWLEDLSTDCEGRPVNGGTNRGGNAIGACNEANQNHHVFNAGLAIGMLNYATMIDIPIDNLVDDGWYIDEAIKQYQKSCCLNAEYLIDLKARMARSASSRIFYQEITDHLISQGADLASCHCKQINSTSIYSAGISLGWAEFAAFENVSADYIASTYMSGAVTHVEASNCLDATPLISLRDQMTAGGDSKGFYMPIQNLRLEISDQAMTHCACDEREEQSTAGKVVERTSLCGTVNEAGGNAPERYTIQFSQSTGEFIFSFNTFTVPDRMQVFSKDQLLYDSECVGTRGWKDEKLALIGSNQVTVNIIPDCTNESNTKWSFEVSCPGEMASNPSARKTGNQDRQGSSGAPDGSAPVDMQSPKIPDATTSTSTPKAPVGPRTGEWWYPVEKDHPWRGKGLEEILQMGGVLQMYTHRSMSPDNYYLTDGSGKWINYNPGTHGASTYYYVDWKAFNQLFDLIEKTPITNNGALYQRLVYKAKAEDKQVQFRVYRQSGFNPHQFFDSEVFQWAIGKDHPWYDMSEEDIRKKGATPFMYFKNFNDYNTNIYQDPNGQLIAANGRWRNKMYQLDWDRFMQNHTLIAEQHKFQKWKHTVKGVHMQIHWY